MAWATVGRETPKRSTSMESLGSLPSSPYFPDEISLRSSAVISSCLVENREFIGDGGIGVQGVHLADWNSSCQFD